MAAIRGRRCVRVVLADAGNAGPTLDAWWYYAAHGVLALARVGTSCLLVGRVRVREGKRPSVAHPDLIRDEPATRTIRARYPSLGVAPGALRRALTDVLARVASLPDPVPSDVALRERMPPAEPLLRAVHGAPSGIAPAAAARSLGDRLAWVEAFTRIWQRMDSDAAWGDARAPKLAAETDAIARLVDALGFALTGAQERAIEAVRRDLARAAPMRRLLLGDVGTGKTAVALAAAAQCVAAGYQCALLAPTGILAEQYRDAAAPLVRAVGARLSTLTGGIRVTERRSLLEQIAAGHAQVVIGTHALLGQDVTFARLGLVIVDEQQRLGVAQRLALVRKGAGGSRPHLLSLSATPIPRTMALAVRGELATTLIDERPPGREPVRTEILPQEALEAVVASMREACARGERAFFVVPRVEGDDEEEESGVVERAERLARRLAPARVVVVHGAMPAPERDRAMRAFRRGDAQVLVGTTVVEVGVDVPEATVMVVDQANRFGLAQLHQLRGRVGRGAHPSRCVLLYEAPLSAPARQRLETLVRTHDGAEVARADLALRGAGELGGTRQSGLEQDFVWLDALDPPPWIERIEADVRSLRARDPELTAPEHRALAHAMRRFAVALAVREEAG
jgi:ATP-dependent DNA helicase RecG